MSSAVTVASVGPETVRRVGEVAGAEHTTVPVVLLALAGVLVHRHVRWDEVEVGASMRPAADAAILGAPAPPLMFSLSVAEGMTFAAAVRQVAERVRAAGAEALITTAAPVSSQSVLFLTLQSPRQRHNLVPDAARDGSTIALRVAFGGGGVDISPEASGIDDATPVRLARQFARLAESAAASPDDPVSHMELLPREEYDEVVVAWNATDRDVPDAPVHVLFARQAAATPDAIALVSESETISYAQLDERANQLSHCLRALGVGIESPVGLLLERSIDAVVAIFAIMKAGGPYVPLDPTYPAARIDEIVDDCRLSVVVTRSQFRGRMAASPSIAVVELDGDALTGQPTVAPLVPVTPDNAAYILYTSGSEGRPKPVIGTHRSITNSLGATLFRDADRGAVGPIDASLSFAFSLSRVFMPLLCGRKIAVLTAGQERDLVTKVDFWSRHAVTSAAMVTPVCHQLVAFGRRLTARLPGLRVLITGGSLVSRELVTALLDLMPQLTIVVVYASTEMGGGILNKFIDAGAAALTDGIGRACPNNRLYILDAALQPVPVGVVGEVYLWAPHMSRGYLGRPARTAERFVPNPFARRPGDRMYRSGDLGRYLPNGEMALVGRADDMVKVRGFRIELPEIERALTRHPDVTVAAVTVRKLAAEPQVVAYVVAGTEALRPWELREFLAARLPEYMLPQRFVFLEALPLTAVGKVDRAALPPVGSERPPLKALYEPPHDDLEAGLAGMWESLLGFEQVGIDDDFFELGADSMFAGRFAAFVWERYGTPLAVADVFDRPTVRHMAAHLRTCATGATTEGGLH